MCFWRVDIFVLCRTIHLWTIGTITVPWILVLLTVGTVSVECWRQQSRIMAASSLRTTWSAACVDASLLALAFRVGQRKHSKRLVHVTHTRWMAGPLLGRPRSGARTPQLATSHLAGGHVCSKETFQNYEWCGQIIHRVVFWQQTRTLTDIGVWGM